MEDPRKKPLDLDMGLAGLFASFGSGPLRASELRGPIGRDKPKDKRYARGSRDHADAIRANELAVAKRRKANKAARSARRAGR